MCLDIQNFYLGTPMKSFEYMRIPIKLIPQEIIDQYDLLMIFIGRDLIPKKDRGAFNHV
jgi:hypothetical protein